MKATQLDQMSADYENVNRSKEMSKQIITEKEQVCIHFDDVSMCL